MPESSYQLAGYSQTDMADHGTRLAKVIERLEASDVTLYGLK